MEGLWKPHPSTMVAAPLSVQDSYPGCSHQRLVVDEAYLAVGQLRSRQDTRVNTSVGSVVVDTIATIMVVNKYGNNWG